MREWDRLDAVDSGGGMAESVRREGRESEHDEPFYTSRRLQRTDFLIHLRCSDREAECLSRPRR